MLEAALEMSREKLPNTGNCPGPGTGTRYYELLMSK